MLYTQKTITLKDGRKAVFRSPELSDAKEMLDYLTKATGETEFLASYPEELTYTVESEAAYIQNILNSPQNMMIACTVDGKLAGNCQIVFLGGMKTRHRAAVMIGLLKEFWGLGIGSAMFREMELAARQNGIEQMELEMIEGNERGLSLYKKMGFDVMAEHPNAFKLKDGSLRKAIYMRKLL